jgi:hypothetical protein
VHAVSSKGGSNSSISSYIPFLFLIGSVIGLLQVKDLFETHPANMRTSVAALPIFCFSHAANKKIINRAQLIDALRVLSAALVVASLLSVLLPDRLCYLPFLMWLLLAASILAYPGLIKAFHSVIYISKRPRQRTTVEPDALPV